MIIGRLMEVQLYTEWDDNHVCTSNLRVRGDKLSAELSLMREIGVVSPQAYVKGGRYTRCCRLMASSTEEVGLRLPVFLRTLPDMIRDK